MDESDQIAHQVALMEAAERENAAEKERRMAAVPSVIAAFATAYVAREKEVGASDKFAVAVQSRVLGERLDKHMKMERALHFLNEDLKDTTGKVMRARQTLESVESRVLGARSNIRNSNDSHDVSEKLQEAIAANDYPQMVAMRNQMNDLKMIRSAKERVDDELGNEGGIQFSDGLEPCPKCSIRFIPGMLKLHLSSCDGAAPTLPPLPLQDEEDEEEDDEISERGAERKSGKSLENGKQDEWASEEEDLKDKGYWVPEEDGEEDEGEEDATASQKRVRRDPHRTKMNGPAGSSSYQTSSADADGFLSEEEEAALRMKRDRELLIARNSMSQCPICMAKIIPSRLPRHQQKCLGKHKLEVVLGKWDAGKNAAREIPLSLRGPPPPPTRVRLLAPTSSTVPIVWNAPPTDGGAPITNYEIEFYSKRAKWVGSDWVDNEVRMPTVSTSRWIFFRPVSSSGYTLTNLPAATTFCKFRVRAVNSYGHGEWSPLGPEVMSTLAPSQISAPLHFSLLCSPEPECATFYWEDPMDNGGQGIEQYELHYEHLVNRWVWGSLFLCCAQNPPTFGHKRHTHTHTHTHNSQSAAPKWLLLQVPGRVLGSLSEYASPLPDSTP